VWLQTKTTTPPLAESDGSRGAKAATLILSFLTQQDVSETEAAKYSYRTQQIFAGPDGREILTSLWMEPDFVA
jgi:hypothetical protein